MEAPATQRSLRARGEERTFYGEYGSVDRAGEDKTSASFRAKLSAGVRAASGAELYKSGRGDLVVNVPGKDFTVAWARANGLGKPMHWGASEREALGITVPVAKGFGPRQVAGLVGDRRKVVAMAAATQTSNVSLSLEAWADYWDSDRSCHGVLNLISLEFTGTALADRVEAPRFVREVDWIDVCFPLRGAVTGGAGKRNASSSGSSVASASSTSGLSSVGYRHKGTGSGIHGRPKVQKYCLMSSAGSYTDFHLDFGGTSVWYHLLFGAKVFLLAPPTPAVLSAYEAFTFDSGRFLPDLLPPGTFTRAELKGGETLFIPSGWVHAVLTPADSLVFGGNFLHAFALKEQAEVRDVEDRTQVAPEMRFPLDADMYWRAAAQYACLVLRAQARRGSDGIDGVNEHGIGGASEGGSSGYGPLGGARWTRGMTCAEVRDVRTYLVNRCVAKAACPPAVAAAAEGAGAPEVVAGLRALFKAEEDYLRDWEQRASKASSSLSSSSSSASSTSSTSSASVAAAASGSIGSALSSKNRPKGTARGQGAVVAAVGLEGRSLVAALAPLLPPGSFDGLFPNVSPALAGSRGEGPGEDDAGLPWYRRDPAPHLTAKAWAALADAVKAEHGALVRKAEEAAAAGKKSGGGGGGGGCGGAGASEALSSVGVLPVGTVVLAKCRRSAKTYPGVIIAVHPDPSAIAAASSAAAGVAAHEALSAAAAAEVAAEVKGAAAVEPTEATEAVNAAQAASNVAGAAETTKAAAQKLAARVAAGHALLKQAKATARRVAYSVAFDDGDHDARVKREHVKGRPLGEGWAEARLLALRRLAARDAAAAAAGRLARAQAPCGGGGGRGGRGRSPPGTPEPEWSLPFEAPTATIEPRGAKRARAVAATASHRGALLQCLESGVAAGGGRGGARASSSSLPRRSGPHGGGGGGGGGGGQAYSAKALFRKHHLASVKARLPPGTPKPELKAALDAMWEAAPAEDAARFEALALASTAAAERSARAHAVSAEAYHAAVAVRVPTLAPLPSLAPTGAPPAAGAGEGGSGWVEVACGDLAGLAAGLASSAAHSAGLRAAATARLAAPLPVPASAASATSAPLMQQLLAPRPAELEERARCAAIVQSTLQFAPSLAVTAAPAAEKLVVASEVGEFSAQS